MIKFAYTILYVPDVEESLAFYEKAFGFNRKFVAPGNEYGELDTGNTTLSFCAFSLAAKGLPGGFRQSDPAEKPLGVEIAFATDNVQQLYDQALAAGAKSLAAPDVKPWGQTVAYVRDNNGHLVEICTPVE